MKLHTEPELLKQQTINLEYCTLLEKDGLISLDELNTLIPGYIHLNNIHTGGLDYLSKKALEILEKDMEEIRAQGSRFVQNISDLKSQHIFLQKRAFFLNPSNRNKTFSYIQRLHYKPKNISHTLFYSISKVYKDRQNCLTYTQPLHLLQNHSFLKEIVEKRYEFYNQNHHKFCKLSPRESEILKLVAGGFTNKKISEQLFISIETVKTHRKNICKKLETNKVTDYVKFAQTFLEE